MTEYYKLSGAGQAGVPGSSQAAAGQERPAPRPVGAGPGALRAGELGRARGRAAARRLFAGKDAGFHREALRGLSGEDPAALRAIAPRTGLARTQIYDLLGGAVPYSKARAFEDSYEEAHWAEAAAVSRAAPGQAPGGTCVLLTSSPP